jgi:hypothetical protein
MLASIRKFSLCLLVSLSPLSALATEMTTTIDKITVWDGLQLDGTQGAPWVFVYPHDVMPTSPPLPGGCGDAYYSFRLDRPYAKEYLAALLVAKANSSQVYLRGLGWCKDQSIGETLLYFRVN